MFLDYIGGIAKIGGKVVMTTRTGKTEGVIIKLSKEMIAVQETDGSIVVKKDADITNILILSEKSNNEECLKLQDQSEIPERGGMTFIRNDKAESFTCNICGKNKTSNRFAIETANPNSKICKHCYGIRLLRLK